MASLLILQRYLRQTAQVANQAGGKRLWGHPMHGSGLSLVVWQGWGVLSVMALLTALLAILLAWLLPFPDRSLGLQLTRYEDRIALKYRLGGGPPFYTYLQTVHRLNEWLMEWFGTAFSVQAFERCVAIAFIFPIGLFLLTLAANGLTTNHITFFELTLFLLAFAVFSYVIGVAFGNLLRIIRNAWTRFGGDAGLAQMISRVLLGAFAVMVAFTISFAIAATFSGQVSNASSVLGSMAGGFAVAFALAIAFALAGAVLFSIAIAILAGVALAFASNFTMLLFLFFVLLPVVNACVDWLSWGATRFLLEQAECAGPDVKGGLRVAGTTLGTFASGAALMVLLSALLPNALEILNTLFGVAKLPPFDWQAMAQRSVDAPWTDGLFVTGMLMTPLVPASSHLTVALAGLLARFTPGARAAAEIVSDHPEVGLTPAETPPVKLALVISRVWYVPAVAITIGVIALASWLISITHTPVAHFLSSVAHCSTYWSHGQCGWF